MDRTYRALFDGVVGYVNINGVSDWSRVVEATVAGDALAPAAPTGLTATAIPEGIKLEWVNPSANADGSACGDMRWVRVYYKSTAGVSKSSNNGSYTLGGRAGANQAFSDNAIAAGTARYYVVTALDTCGNESTESAEATASAGSIEETTNIPDDAGGLIFDDSVGTEGIVAGDGILGIVFQQPASTWVGFDHYRLWYAVDSGGGFGAWAEIAPVPRNGYVFKGLATTSSYRFKATVVATDGTESTTPDKAKANDAGYMPNSSDNSSLVAINILAENLIATNEVRGDHFCATSFLSINDNTFGNKGIQAQYNAGTPRLYAGDGANAFIRFDGTKLTWKAANASLDASGNLSASSATLSGTITCGAGSSYSGLGTLSTLNAVGASNCDTTIISSGKIITSLLTASNIQTGSLSATRISGGTLDCSAITVTNLSANSITAGTLSAITVRTATSGERAEMATSGTGAHGVRCFRSTGDQGTGMSYGGYAIYDTSGDEIGFWANTSNHPQFSVYGTKARVSVDQSSTTGAQECLSLDQADSSEGFINFIGSDRGEIGGLVGSDASVRVELNGTVYRLALYEDA